MLLCGVVAQSRLIRKVRWEDCQGRLKVDEKDQSLLGLQLAVWEVTCSSRGLAG